MYTRWFYYTHILWFFFRTLFMAMRFNGFFFLFIFLLDFIHTSIHRRPLVALWRLARLKAARGKNGNSRAVRCAQ